MMRALIQKDLRLCRLAVIAGILLLVAPFVIASATVIHSPLWTEATANTAWAVLLGTGCYFSLMCSQPTLAILSGDLLAAERADRSAEFLAYLPPSRGVILLSKLCVLAGGAAVIWGFYFCVYGLAVWLAGETEAATMVTSELAPPTRLAAIGLAAVGGGWIASSLSENTGPAVALAFMTPIAILGLIALNRSLTNRPDDLEFAAVYDASCVMVGVSTFVAGCTVFLRRIEP